MKNTANPRTSLRGHSGEEEEMISGKAFEPLTRDFIRTDGGGVPQKSFTVSVMEDDESIRRAIGRLLRSVGYHGVTFESAEEFLDSISGTGEGTWTPPPVKYVP